MNLLPLSAPLNSRDLMMRSCHLYRIGWISALPFSVLWVAMYEFLRLGKALWPVFLQPYYMQIAMIIAVLIPPAMAMVILAYDSVGRAQTSSVSSIALDMLHKMLVFLAVLISMLLIPALVGGLLLGIYLLLLKYQVPEIWLCFYPIVACLILYLSFVHNLMAPFLALSDNVGANQAIEQGQKLVKSHYGLTFIYGLYAVLVVVFIMMLPFLINYYWPDLGGAPWLRNATSAVLLVIISPWSFAFLLTFKFQLQSLAKAPQQKTSS